MSLRSAQFKGSITIICAEALLPYERPPLSKEALSRENPMPRLVASGAVLAAAEIDARLGCAASAIDTAGHSVLLANGSELGYDKLLLATGTESRLLPLANPAAARIGYLRTFADATKIRRALTLGGRLIVVGGGFIGLEVAASAVEHRCDVTVIEALPRLLSRVVPAEVADIVEAKHLSQGVKIRCGTEVERIEERDGTVDVTTGDGDRLSADFLVVGIGATPSTDLAKKAGLEVANGIVVDEHLRASVPDVYAAGDCCSFPLAIYDGRRVRLESWRNAQDQGAVAGRNMAGSSARMSNVPWFWSDQYDLTLQISGLVDEGALVVRRPVGDDAFVLFHLAADGRLVAASGIGVGNAIARDIRLAEMLIVQRAKPDSSALASPAIKLKTLLAA
jgi:3-phenylpropionate/trans-cinnamate dioxygenase ferredoxin reductase subunit